MKKLLLSLVISIMVITMLLTFSIVGCKKETAETTAAPETTAVSATTAATETTAVETTAASTEPDPWILEMRAGLDQFRGEINYKGEYGATPTWDTELFLTLAEVEQIKKGNAEGKKWKVGYVMDASAGDHTNSLLKGMKDVLDHLGMELIGTVDPQFDPAKERAGVENFLVGGADIIIGAPIDATASGESFRPVIDAGKKLVIWSNIPKGYEYGKDYVGVSSAMAQDLGVFTVDIMKKDVAEKTEVAYLYFDQSFWVVNLIDTMVKEALAAEPNFDVVEELGYGKEADATDLMTAALSRHPNITRVYGGWNVVAQFAADGVKSLGRDDVKIATFGVDEPTLISILTGGNIFGTVSDDPYHLGANLALLAGYAAIDKKAPEFTITPAIPVTIDNLEEAWDITQKTPLPESVKEALGK
ncbi:MAG: substrate-binding domain-containing protein [Actinobacteria bacterium]|nr:substrate-binding domain-containing protein [Actinomycetota bacterium]